MAGRGATSFQKRQKEQQRKDKQAEKQARRQQRKVEKLTAGPTDPFAIDTEYETERDDSGDDLRPALVP